jgi:hypothetical protein
MIVVEYHDARVQSVEDGCKLVEVKPHHDGD